MVNCRRFGAQRLMSNEVGWYQQTGFSYVNPP